VSPKMGQRLTDNPKDKSEWIRKRLEKWIVWYLNKIPTGQK